VHGVAVGTDTRDRGSRAVRPKCEERDYKDRDYEKEKKLIGFLFHCPSPFS
jgi:hypothetical protein